MLPHLVLPLASQLRKICPSLLIYWRSLSNNFSVPLAPLHFLLMDILLGSHKLTWLLQLMMP